MKSRRELKALLLASITALTLMSGCSKDNNNKETTEREKAYYMVVGDEYVEIENVKSVVTPSYCGTYTTIEFNDGTTMIIPVSNLYIMDKTSGLQQELIKKLTN